MILNQSYEPVILKYSLVLIVSLSDFHVTNLRDSLHNTIFCMHWLLVPTEIHVQSIITSSIILS
jgi:hypothetical protein